MNQTKTNFFLQEGGRSVERARWKSISESVLLLKSSSEIQNVALVSFEGNLFALRNFKFSKTKRCLQRGRVMIGWRPRGKSGWNHRVSNGISANVFFDTKVPKTLPGRHFVGVSTMTSSPGCVPRATIVILPALQHQREAPYLYMTSRGAMTPNNLKWPQNKASWGGALTLQQLDIWPHNHETWDPKTAWAVPKLYHL